MSYDNLIKRQVRNSFKKVGDLAKAITLQQKNVTDFNFASKEVIATTLIITETKYILIEEGRKEASENPSKYMKIIISSEDISDPDIYDKAIINGDVWTIVTPFENNGYIITLLLNKEA